MPNPQETGAATFLGPRWSYDAERNQPQAIWVYRITKPNWQQAVLTSDGMFAVVGDYGNYAYSWSNWGDAEFRAFFAQINSDYLLRKIAGSRETFYEEETQKELRRVICEQYKTRQISKAVLREVLEILREADLSTFEGLESMLGETVESAGDKEVHEVLEHDAWDIAEFGAPRDAVAYCEKLLPALQEAVRAQLEGR